MSNTTKRPYTPRTEVTEPCKACGHLFARPRTASKYCGRADCHTVCNGCGKEIAFVVRQGANPKSWCTRSCRRKHQPSPSLHHAPRSSIHLTECVYCGDLFVGRTIKSKRCKSKDCERAWNRERSADFQRKWKAEHGNGYTTQWRRRNPERAKEYNACYTVTCEICGNVYRSSKPNARYCAGTCTDIAKVNAAQSLRYRATVKQKRALRGSRGTGRFTQGPCNQCGTPFMTAPRGTSARYCSPTCSEKARSLRRNARERGAPGIPPGTAARWQVYARHDFKCWLCELPLNMDAHYLEDDAPTIDHVVPLAAGGTHEDDNLRPAHRWCNSVKGHRDEW